MLRPADERLLAVGADLHERDLREAGVHERLDLLDELVDVSPAGQLVAHVLRANELGRRLEAGWSRQVGVDLPEPEPAELVVHALDGGVAVGIVGDRDLTDLGLPRPPAASNFSTSSGLGSVATMISAMRPASEHDR